MAVVNTETYSLLSKIISKTFDDVSGDIVHITQDEQSCNELLENKYEFGDIIGHGGFGCVRDMRRRSDGKSLAVKIIQRVSNRSWSQDDDWGIIPREVFLLKYLNHPNVVKLVDVYESIDYIYMVTEKPDYCIDLFEFVEKNVGDITEDVARYIFVQITKAVAYLHFVGLTHRDIKDENVLLDVKTLKVTLIDFGSTTELHNGFYTQFRGTKEYISPEVLIYKCYQGVPAECWAMGVLLYTLIFSSNPFENEDQTIAGKLTFPIPVSGHLIDLLQWMLQVHPNKRPTMKQILLHPWCS